MANFSIQEILAVIGNKELTIMGLSKDIELLQAKVKELEDKFIPKVESKKPELVEVKKEK